MFGEPLFYYTNEKKQILSQFLQNINPRDTQLNRKVEDLFTKLYIEELVVFPNRVTKSKRIVEVPSYFHQDEYVKRIEYTFKLPYTGDPNLFKYRGSRFSTEYVELGMHKNYVEFQVLDEFNSAEQVAKEYKESLRYIQEHINIVNEEVRLYNASLKQSLEGFVSNRLNELAKKHEEEQLAGLPPDEDEINGDITIPLFFKPKLEPHLDSLLTETDEQNYVLDQRAYDELLESIIHAATYMENHVKSFSKMEEEEIRDHILSMLNGMLSIRATGETFNGKGKTDILYPYREKNLFISECKFWHGQSEFIKAIGQLEGYLGWNDTKTALLIFYRNKESMTEKIEEMRKHIRSMPNFVSAFPETIRGGRFLMKHPQDNKKSYFLELITFNLGNE